MRVYGNGSFGRESVYRMPSKRHPYNVFSGNSHVIVDERLFCASPPGVIGLNCSFINNWRREILKIHKRTRFLLALVFVIALPIFVNQADSLVYAETAD